jgi:CRP-like cAMP-binding protein
MPASISRDPAEQWLKRIDPRGTFSDADKQAVRQVLSDVRPFEAGDTLIREGDRAPAILIFEGFLSRRKGTPSGTRQILSILLRGDILPS